jgi:tetratricopeptide (TPR) repeat protein
MSSYQGSGLTKLAHPFAISRRLSPLCLAIFSVLLLASAAHCQNASRQPATHSRDPLLIEAETLMAQGQIAEAKQKLTQAVAESPSSVEAYNLLGIIYTGEKDFSNASDALQHALKLDASSPGTHINLGNLDLAEGKSALAQQEFRTVLQSHPANAEANYDLGVLLLSSGKPAEAILHFKRVQPQNVQTQMNLVRAYLDAHQTPQALALAKQISAAHKDKVQVHFTLGMLLAGEKQYRPALLELETADALAPETFEILRNLGETYFRAGDYAKAEVALNRALKIKPESADTLYLVGELDAAQGRSVDALDALVHAHKLAPENLDVILLLGRTSIAQNYFEDAIPLLESGVKLAPQRADLRAALGEGYFLSGKVEKSLEEFRSLVSLDPSARSYGLLGLTYRHLGRFAEASKYFHEGLKRDPRDAFCIFNLGYIEERQGNTAKAEELFRESLRLNPNLADALLELADLRIASKKFTEAAQMLRRYVKISPNPASGYYKLAMVERSLHQTEAADRDLATFQTLSRDTSAGAYHPHLFDYLDDRASLSLQARAEVDVAELTERVREHPDRTQDLYLLAGTQFKLGNRAEALQTIAHLDELSRSDERLQTAIGVLLARNHLYQPAIQHFQTALQLNPESNDVKFDLAEAYFRTNQYAEALASTKTISDSAQQDDAFLALLGDIQAHLGNTDDALATFHKALARSPDNDQYYLSLALAQLRRADVTGAKRTLLQGLARIPNSGKLLWGMGLVAILEGKEAEAANRLERSVDLLPEWPGSYATLGVFYYQTGQIAKAREVLQRFKSSDTNTGMDIGRIEQVLARAPAADEHPQSTITPEARRQLLQFALSIADRTL